MIYSGTAQSLNGLACDLIAHGTLYQSCHSRCSCVGFFPSRSCGLAATAFLWQMQCLQPWLGAFSIFLPFFSIFMAISVFLIFLTGVTSNSRRWEVVKLSVSPKRPFFFYLPGVVSGVACSFLFQLHNCTLQILS